MLPRTFSSRRREMRAAFSKSARTAAQLCRDSKRSRAIDTLNPGLFASTVAQRADRVVPPTASVFRNCPRQRRRELTRRNHLLLALAQVRSGLILRVEGSACGPTSVLRRTTPGRGISFGVMLLATRTDNESSPLVLHEFREERA